MKSLKKYPSELVENFTDKFCDELWDEAITSGNNCRHLASAICELKDTLRNFMIRELYASSIVEDESCQQS